MATKVRSAFPLEGQEGGESKMAVYLRMFRLCERACALMPPLCVREREREEEACVIRQYLPKIYNGSVVYRHGLIKFRSYQNPFVPIAPRIDSIRSSP